MRDFGGMVSFTCKGGQQAALQIVRHTKLFTLAESLGAVESLIEHPGLMTHASAAGSPLQVPASLVRLSVGIEAAADLVADLATALDHVRDAGRSGARLSEQRRLFGADDTHSRPRYEMLHEHPGAAMNRRGTISLQCGLVQRARITLVGLEVPIRKVLCLLAHDAITRHLGEYRGGGHR